MLSESLHSGSHSQSPDFEALMFRIQKPIGIEEWILRNRDSLPPEFDITKYVRGNVIGIIIGDDINNFIAVSLVEGTNRYDEVARARKEALQVRLEWEHTSPGLPAEIRPDIEAVLKFARHANWGNSESFRNTYNQWQNMRQKLSRMVDTNPEYDDAYNYARDHYNEVYRLYNLSVGKTSIAA